MFRDACFVYTTIDHRVGKRDQCATSAETRGSNSLELKKDSDFDERAILPIQTVIESRRVRLTEWIKPDIVALLQSRTIICFVHHGEANSFFEATW